MEFGTMASSVQSGEGSKMSTVVDPNMSHIAAQSQNLSPKPLKQTSKYIHQTYLPCFPLPLPRKGEVGGTVITPVCLSASLCFNLKSIHLIGGYLQIKFTCESVIKHDLHLYHKSRIFFFGDFSAISACITQKHLIRLSLCFYTRWNLPLVCSSSKLTQIRLMLLIRIENPISVVGFQIAYGKFWN